VKLAIALLAFLLVLCFLVAFAVVGIVCFINPEWGIKHFRRGKYRGGDLKQEWDRLGISLAGAVMAGFVLYVLTGIVRNFLAHH
jgi:ABC-type Fe3+ transport system permease subunit